MCRGGGGGEGGDTFCIKTKVGNCFLADKLVVIGLILFSINHSTTAATVVPTKPREM